MDIMTSVGLVSGIIVVSVMVLMGGDLHMFISEHAMIIIFGGSIAATMIRFPRQRGKAPAANHEDGRYQAGVKPAAGSGHDAAIIMVSRRLLSALSVPVLRHRPGPRPLNLYASLMART